LKCLLYLCTEGKVKNEPFALTDSNPWHPEYKGGVTAINSSIKWHSVPFHYVKLKTQTVCEGKLQSIYRTVLGAETVFPQHSVLLENADVTAGLLASELISNLLKLL